MPGPDPDQFPDLDPLYYLDPDPMLGTDPDLDQCHVTTLNNFTILIPCFNLFLMRFQVPILISFRILISFQILIRFPI